MNERRRRRKKLEYGGCSNRAFTDNMKEFVASVPEWKTVNSAKFVAASRDTKTARNLFFKT